MAATAAGLTKKQIDKAGHALRHRRDIDPEAFLDAILLVDAWRARHAKPLRTVNAGLRYYIRKFGVAEQEVTQRLKRLVTIVGKLDRQPQMALSRMEDIGGVRAIVEDQQRADRIVADLERQPRWKLRRVRRYIEGEDPGPKSDGYRAIHVVVEKGGCFVEIQLRTPFQDAWAQSVEQDTRRLSEGLKFGAGPADLREYYLAISHMLAMRERNEPLPPEFMERLAELFAGTRRFYSEEQS